MSNYHFLAYPLGAGLKSSLAVSFGLLHSFLPTTRRKRWEGSRWGEKTTWTTQKNKTACYQLLFNLLESARREIRRTHACVRARVRVLQSVTLHSHPLTRSKKKRKKEQHHHQTTKREKRKNRCTANKSRKERKRTPRNSDTTHPQPPI